MSFERELASPPVATRNGLASLWADAGDMLEFIFVLTARRSMVSFRLLRFRRSLLKGSHENRRGVSRG
jgi:hypothetical protein